jgi:hypothetical protein
LCKGCVSIPEHVIDAKAKSNITAKTGLNNDFKIPINATNEQDNSKRDDIKGQQGQGNVAVVFKPDTTMQYFMMGIMVLLLFFVYKSKPVPFLKGKNK